MGSIFFSCWRCCYFVLLMRMGALYILVIVLSSTLFFLRLCGAVATGPCSWSCSSPNHPGGIADTVGPQLEDLQHCCLGECCLKIQLGEVSEESVVHLFDFISMVSSCSSYYINVLGRPKYLAPPEFAFNCRMYSFNLHPGVPFFKKFLKDGLPSAHSKVNEGTGQGNITILIAAPVAVQNHCADRIIHHWL